MTAETLFAESTVLLVDAGLESSGLVSHYLSGDFNVLAVDDPSSAIGTLEHVMPEAIICDVAVHVAAISIARVLKADFRTAHIPLVILSDRDDIDSRIEGIEAGADLFVTKPFDVDLLRASLRRLIAHKEALKEYFASPLSTYHLVGGRLTHIDHRKFVRQVLDVIAENLINRELSARFIASRMNMSLRSLYLKLREIGADSPSQMIRESRLHVACNLLLNTTMTIDEVMHKSGFSNRAPFFAAFSDKFSCTPREYRNRQISLNNSTSLSRWPLSASLPERV